MHVDIEKYAANKYYAIEWYENRSGRDVISTVTAVAAITAVPCIAIAFWLGEHTQWKDPQCEKSIRVLIDFYGYTVIENKPLGSPI